MTGTFVLCFSLLIASATLENTIEAVLAEYNWSKIQPKTTLRPSPRLGALTWVDHDNWLWLFGGKNISNNTTNQLYDLWKFNTNKFKWYHIPNTNNSKLPSNGLTCFCAGLVFILGSHSDKAMLDYKLWTYNTSANVWHFRDLPESLKDNHNYLALWCNHVGMVSLLSNPNKTSLSLWNYTIKTAKWKSLILTGTEDFANLLSKNTSKYAIWADTYSTKYIYLWPAGVSNNSMLFSITRSKFKIVRVMLPGPCCRTEFVHWTDLAGNLCMLGGKMCNSSQLYSDQWILNTSILKWVYVDFNKTSTRSNACSWKVGNSVWIYGGYVGGFNGKVVVLNDLWLGNPSKHVVPKVPEHLPGDTLGLSMANKLVISTLVLLVVMTISVRLCYKRELNLMLTKMRRRRVPYHQLSQEGDKTSRL